MGIFKISPKIGLALGGGAARGLLHLGVLRAFEEKNVRLHAITGNSSGSIVASLYAFGMKLEHIYEVLTTKNWLRPQMGDFSLTRGGVFKNENIGIMIEDCLGQVNIEDAKIPLALVASDILTGKRVILNRGPLVPAIMASCCVQGIFVPIVHPEHPDRLLTDGGIVENVPISPLRRLGAEFIYAVNLNGQSQYRAPKDFIDVISNALDIAIDTTTRIQLRKAHAVLEFDLLDFDRGSAARADELFELGLAKARECFTVLNPTSPFVYYRALRTRKYFR